MPDSVSVAKSTAVVLCKKKHVCVQWTTTAVVKTTIQLTLALTVVNTQGRRKQFTGGPAQGRV